MTRPIGTIGYPAIHRRFAPGHQPTHVSITQRWCRQTGENGENGPLTANQSPTNNPDSLVIASSSFFFAMAACSVRSRSGICRFVVCCILGGHVDTPSHVARGAVRDLDVSEQAASGRLFISFRAKNWGVSRFFSLKAACVVGAKIRWQPRQLGGWCFLVSVDVSSFWSIGHCCSAVESGERERKVHKH